MECPAVLCLLAAVVSATSLECPGGKCSSQSMIDQVFSNMRSLDDEVAKLNFPNPPKRFPNYMIRPSDNEFSEGDAIRTSGTLASGESNDMISAEYDSLSDKTFVKGFLQLTGKELTGDEIVAELQRTSWMGPITSLKISECEILNLTTDTFDLVKDTLQQLSIVNCSLTSLAALSELSHLKFLNLSHNNLDSQEFLNAKPLADSLEVLDVSHNQLSYICSTLAPPNIRELNMSHNNIDSLFWYSERSSIDSLEVLDLSHNKLVYISDDLAFPNLRELNLSHNKLDFTFWYSLQFFVGQVLKVLDVSYNNLQVFDWIPAKSSVDSLEVLNLSHNKLDIICNNFSFFPNLRELDMSHNNLKSFHLIPVNSSADSLEVLDMSYNKLNTISTNFSFFPNLRELNISHNNLESFNLIPVKSLADSLEVLDMSYNKLDTISTNLAFYPNLQELNLSYNRISVIDDYPINSLEKLEVLSLRYNILGNATLSNLQNLKQLDVSWNYLREAGDVLQLPPQRLSLRLDSNPWNCDCGLLETRDNNDVLDLDSVQCTYFGAFSECFYCPGPRPYLPSVNGQYVANLTNESISPDGCPAPVQHHHQLLFKRLKSLTDRAQKKIELNIVVHIVTVFFVFLVIFICYSFRSKKLPKRSWLTMQIPHLNISKADSKVQIPYIKVEEPKIKNHSLIRLL